MLMIHAQIDIIALKMKVNAVIYYLQDNAT